MGGGRRANGHGVRSFREIKLRQQCQRLEQSINNVMKVAEPAMCQKVATSVFGYDTHANEFKHRRNETQSLGANPSIAVVVNKTAEAKNLKMKGLASHLKFVGKIRRDHG